MEKRIKDTMFDYELNSNTISFAERKKQSNEPTGEADTLKGKKLYKMGDKANPSNKNKKFEKKETPLIGDGNKTKEAKSLAKKTVSLDKSKISFDQYTNILYKPKTKESTESYRELLKIISTFIPDQSSETIIRVLDEILALLLLTNTENDNKNNNISSNRTKYNDLSNLLPELNKEIFEKILSLSNSLQDYFLSTSKQNKNHDDHIAIQIDQSDSEKEDGNNSEEVSNEDDLSDKEEEEDEDEYDINQLDKDQEDELDNEVQSNYDLSSENDDEGENNKETEKTPLFTQLKQYNFEPWNKSNAINWLYNKISATRNSSLLSSELDSLNREVINTLKTTKRSLQRVLFKVFGQNNIELQTFILENRFLIYFAHQRALCKEASEEEQIKIEIREIDPEIIDILEYSNKSKNKALKRDFDKKYLNILFKKNINNGFNGNNKHLTSSVYSLPDNAVITKDIGYEKIHLPAIKSSNKNDKIEELEITSTLDDWMLSAFQFKNKENQVELITKHFNKVQSSVLPSALRSDENLLICAPTSSGKTNIAMLCILRLLNKFRTVKNNTNANFKLNKIKAVIITPMKALAKETVGNFSKRLASYNIKVCELSGDSNLSRVEMEEANILVATPEKWDIISRKISMKPLVDSIQLIIIDEIHLLHDTRGVVIESIVARINRNNIKNQNSNDSICRLVGLSATMPNYNDIAAFLNVSNENTFFFDNSFRPVPLEHNFIGVTEKSYIKKLGLMNDITYKLIKERLGMKQVLVFVHSRRETFKTAKYIMDAFTKEGLNEGLLIGNKRIEYSEILKEELNKIQNPDLKRLIPFGIGMHHAGLSKSDKEMVEVYFNSGYLQVIVSTSTLAWGVNLPAHTVVIKGTQVYAPEQGGWIELSIQDILQMMGRAGRVGYGNEVGEGFIITGYNEIKYYISIFAQQLPIESQLLKGLIESINAEIALKTINSTKEGIEWLSHTYLFIRMLKNPEEYGIDPELIAQEMKTYKASTSKAIMNKKESFLKSVRNDLVYNTFILLEKNGLVLFDKKSGSIQSTQLGIIASHYYLKYESISTYNQNIHPNMNMIDLFRLFSLSEEFKLIGIREEEREELEYLGHKVPVPIKGSLDDSCSKINILLQAYISQFVLDGYSIVSDMIFISQNAGRIFRALLEISLKRNWSPLTLLCLNVCKMIDRRMWSSMTPLRQFSGISEDILVKLERKERLTWDRFLEMTPHQIGEVLGVKEKETAGRIVHKLLHMFPKLQLDAYIQPITSNNLQVEVIINVDFNWDPKIHGKFENFWIIMEDNDSEIILHQNLISIYSDTVEFSYKFNVPVIDPLPPQYFLKCVSDKWLNCETILPISFKTLVLPKKFPSNTDLLDTPLISIEDIFSSKSHKNILSLYKERDIHSLYPLQTQVFYSASQNLNESLFCGSASGSGKGLIAEFLCLLQLEKDDLDYKTLNNNNSKKIKQTPIVFIFPNIDSMLNEYNKYKLYFEEKLNHKIGIFTGQIFKDSVIFDKNRIVFTSVEHFEYFSRKVVQKAKSIKTFFLFNLEELNRNRSVYEIIISRIRYISASNDKKNRVRLLCFSQSISNYDDVSSWLEIKSDLVFNFKSTIKPNKVETFIQGFDQFHRDSRLNAMNYTIYYLLDGIYNSSIVNDDRNSSNKIIIVVSDKVQARKLSLNILSYLAEKNLLEKLKSHCIPGEKQSKKEIDQLVSSIAEPTLQHLIKYKIAYYSNTFSKEDKTTIKNFYNNNDIQILIRTIDSVFEDDLKAKYLIIQDTIKFDFKENNYVDYSINEINQAMSKATHFNKWSENEGSNSTGNNNSTIHLLCMRSKKDFYKKFLLESYPVESSLHQNLKNIINTEIVRGIIKDKQLCIDWLSWSFFSHRLKYNPNYYNLQNASNKMINEFVSELVDSAVNELANAECIELKESETGQELLIPLNYGRIANQYFLDYSTIEYFNSNLKESENPNNNNSKTKNKYKAFSSLLELLSSSPDFEHLKLHEQDEAILERLNRQVKYKFDPENVLFNDPKIKSSILLQLYLNRAAVPQEVIEDQKIVIELFMRLINAWIDVLSSNAKLEEALLATTLSQMITQGQIINKSNLLQLPYFSDDLVNKAIKEFEVEDINSFLEMEEQDRNSLLKGFSEEQVQDIAKVCNQFPIYDVMYRVAGVNEVIKENEFICSNENEDIKSNSSITFVVGDVVTLEIKLTRDIETSSDSVLVYSNTLPVEKEEIWWVIVGDRSNNKLLSIKKFKYSKEKIVDLKVNLVEEGDFNLSIIITSDSWIGCDFEEESFKIKVVNE